MSGRFAEHSQDDYFFLHLAVLRSPRPNAARPASSTARPVRRADHPATDPGGAGWRLTAARAQAVLQHPTGWATLVADGQLRRALTAVLNGAGNACSHQRSPATTLSILQNDVRAPRWSPPCHGSDERCAARMELGDMPMAEVPLSGDKAIVAPLGAVVAQPLRDEPCHWLHTAMGRSGDHSMTQLWKRATPPRSLDFVRAHWPMEFFLAVAAPARQCLRARCRSPCTSRPAEQLQATGMASARQRWQEFARVYLTTVQL